MAGPDTDRAEAGAGQAAAESSRRRIIAAAPELPVPKSVATGQPKVLSAWRCTDPLEVTTGSVDPIGSIIKKDAEHTEHCR